MKIHFCKGPKRATHPTVFKLWWKIEQRYQKALAKADLPSLTPKARGNKKYSIKRRFLNSYKKELAELGLQQQPGEKKVVPLRDNTNEIAKLQSEIADSKKRIEACETAIAGLQEKGGDAEATLKEEI